MKKNLLSFLFTMVFGFALYAQTNLDFETWTGNEPDGWITFNGLSQLGAPQSTFKETTDPGESLSSAKMVTVTCAPCTTFGLPATIGGLVNYGVVQGVTPKIGVAYNGRPTSIDFQYKANPMAGDKGLVFVQLSRWDAVASQKVTIGQGYFLADAVVSTWTSNNITVQYANADIPDTMMILSTSSAESSVQGLPGGGGTPTAGSEFFVDSIVINDPCATANLAVTVTGTNETVAGANNGTAAATATGGSPAYTYVWSNGATSASISGLAPGTYTVAIIDANGCATSGSYTVVAGPAGIISANENKFVTVYPNPAINILNFNISGNFAERIFIYDITGKNILANKITGQLLSISLENLSEGIYFYQVKDKDSGNIQTGKFTVVK